MHCPLSIICRVDRRGGGVQFWFLASQLVPITHINSRLSYKQENGNEESKNYIKCDATYKGNQPYEKEEDAVRLDRECVDVWLPGTKRHTSGSQNVEQDGWGMVGLPCSSTLTMPCDCQSNIISQCVRMPSSLAHHRSCSDMQKQF